MSDRKEDHMASGASVGAHVEVRPEDLIAKLEGAASGSRELDFEFHISQVEDAIWPTTDMRGRVTNPHSRMSDYLAAYRDVISADDQDFDFPRYTTSVDAILALVEREFSPGLGWWVEMETAGMGAVLRGPEGEEFKGGGVGTTLPLALCIAFLKARSPDQPRSPNPHGGEGL